MKNTFIHSISLLVAACLWLSASAQQANNYKPLNPNVTLAHTNLPIVFITVDGVAIQRYDRITARMKVIDNADGSLNYADTLAHPGQRIDYEGYIALRYRGNTSFTSSPKKPYSFHTLDAPLEDGGEKKKVSIMGMGKDSKWAMLAPYSDKSLMRDALAFELSRRWMDFTPRTRFCELVLDGTYYGVFVMTEVVSKGKHRLNLDDPGDDGDEITGGYILEVDRDDEAYFASQFPPLDNNGNRYSWQRTKFQYKWPDYEDLTATQRNYIQKAVNEMEKSLNVSYYTDPERGYASKLDVTSFIDYQLAEELAHNVDGYRLSAKMFKRRDSQDPRFKMVLWDLNLAYGNANYYEAWRTDTWSYQMNPMLNSSNDASMVPFWWQRLNSDPAYTAKLKARWAQYRRSNFATERLMATVDSMVNVLNADGAADRNFQAWPKWGKYVWPNYYIASSFDDEINHMKQWLTERLEWMDEKLDFDPDALLPGDVNGDGLIDVEDLNSIINVILGKSQAGDLPGTTDLDGDGMVDVTDVNTTINLILKAS